MRKKKALDITPLTTALAATGVVEPIRNSVDRGEIAILCRVSKEHEQKWLDIVFHLLSTFGDNIFELDISRKYLVVDDNLRFAWNVRMVVGDRGQECVSAVIVELALFKSRRTMVRQSPTKKSAVKPRPVPHPRPSAPAAAPAQNGKPFTMTTVVDEVDDETGNRRREREIPLAHLSEDLNVPSKGRFDPELGRNRGGGKGARKISPGGSR